MLDGKETSIKELERVLRDLFAFYKGRVSCSKVKSLVLKRFDLPAMGYKSFENMLYRCGYGISKDNFMVSKESGFREEPMD